MAVAGLALARAVPAQADPIALTFTDGSTSTSQETRGWEFTTDHSLTVTALGWWDFGGDGLATSHEVGIWNTSGTLLMSGTVAAGTADPLASGFRFDSTLTGTTTLAPGTYIIGGLSATADRVAFAVPAADLTLAPGISFIENRTNNVIGSFSFPNAPQSGLDAGVFGPTFEFAATPVPEPTSAILVITGVLGLLGYGWWRARHAVG
jgi:hypothetical protein